jgi:hypothetical protein
MRSSNYLSDSPYDEVVCKLFLIKYVLNDWPAIVVCDCCWCCWLNRYDELDGDDGDSSIDRRAVFPIAKEPTLSVEMKNLDHDQVDVWK